MNTNDRMEREINLIDLFWGIFLKWRRIICCLLLFAILAGATKYYRDLENYKYGLKVLEESIDEEEVINDRKAQLSKEEQQEIDDVNVLQNLLEQNREYITNSKLMSIDSYEENVAVIEYYIDTNYTFNYLEDNQENYAIEVITAYCNYVTSGQMTEQIIQKNSMDIEEKYINELISTDNENYGNETIFQVYIIYDDVEELKNIVESIKAGIDEQTNVINQSIGSHTLTKLSERIEIRADLELAELQKNQQDRITSLRTQINTLQTTMSEEQLAIVDMERTFSESLNQDTEENEDIEATQAVKPGISKMYVLLGAVLGVFLGCIWIILELLFAARLLNKKELKNMYGLRLFGEITDSGKQNKFLPFIDKFILKIKNKNKKQMTYEQQQYILCSNLEIACKKESIKSIYLTGSEIDKIDDKIIQRIIKELEKSGIVVHQGMNINYDAKSLKEMADTGDVVFVEQTGVSLYQEIADELRVANEQKINILGAIAIS